MTVVSLHDDQWPDQLEPGAPAGNDAATRREVRGSRMATGVLAICTAAAVVYTVVVWRVVMDRERDTIQRSLSVLAEVTHVNSDIDEITVRHRGHGDAVEVVAHYDMRSSDLAVGDTVEVLVDPVDPHRLHVAGQRGSYLPDPFMWVIEPIVAIVAAIAVAWTMARIWRARGRSRALRAPWEVVAVVRDGGEGRVRIVGSDVVLKDPFRLPRSGRVHVAGTSGRRALVRCRVDPTLHRVSVRHTTEPMPPPAWGEPCRAPTIESPRPAQPVVDGLADLVPLLSKPGGDGTTARHVCADGTVEHPSPIDDVNLIVVSRGTKVAHTAGTGVWDRAGQLLGIADRSGIFTAGGIPIVLAEPPMLVVDDVDVARLDFTSILAKGDGSVDFGTHQWQIKADGDADVYDADGHLIAAARTSRPPDRATLNRSTVIGVTGILSACERRVAFLTLIRVVGPPNEKPPDPD